MFLWPKPVVVGPTSWRDPTRLVGRSPGRSAIIRATWAQRAGGPHHSPGPPSYSMSSASVVTGGDPGCLFRLPWSRHCRDDARGRSKRERRRAGDEGRRGRRGLAGGLRLLQVRRPAPQDLREFERTSAPLLPPRQSLPLPSGFYGYGYSASGGAVWYGVLSWERFRRCFIYGIVWIWARFEANSGWGAFCGWRSAGARWLV